jgi:hypothetical protein
LLFEARYPAISWFVKNGGRIEMGDDDSGNIFSFIWAVDMGGWAWMGEPTYDSIEQAFEGAEQGLRKYREDVLGEKLPTSWAGEKTHAASKKARSPRRGT